jgi:hypothetical protein
MKIFRNGIIAGIVITCLAYGDRAAKADTTEKSPILTDTKNLLVPFDNPLKDHEANTMVWNSAYDLSTSGGDWLAMKLGLTRSIPGRVLHWLLTDHMAYASWYYSHETAHYFTNKHSHRFWIDLSNWRRGLPEFIGYDFEDWWDADGWNYYQMHLNDQTILRWLLLVQEAGLYQNRFNAWFRTRSSTVYGLTTFSDGVLVLSNQLVEAKYIIRSGEKPYLDSYGFLVWENLNDITAYFYYMDELKTGISMDTWLACSVSSVLASGQTWNSARAIYNYIIHGEKGVENIEFGIGKSLRVAPPNFYLFPSVQGLYVESETFLRNLLREGDGFFLSIGSGLDALGLKKTGPADRLRFGGLYHSVHLPFSAGLQPYMYFDFTNGFRQTGYSIGAVVESPAYRRFFMTTSIDFSRNDMIRQVIMGREEGFRFLATLGYRM